MGWQSQSGLACLEVLRVHLVAAEESLAIPLGAAVQHKHRFSGTKSVPHPASVCVHVDFISSTARHLFLKKTGSNKINLLVAER